MISETQVGAGITELLLQFQGQSCDYYGVDIKTLKVVVSMETKESLHVKIVDPADERWEVPEEIIPRANRPVLGELGKIFYFILFSPGGKICNPNARSSSPL